MRKKVTEKNKKRKPRTRAVVTKKQQELLWLGAQRLMGEAITPKEKTEKNLIIVTARVLDVSPFGINILGTLPYINKLGLDQKAHQYHKNVKYIYKWIKRAKDDTEKAICDCKLMDGKKELCDWISGECSPSTIKMGTLKGYQNHMAQTRARNRAILETFGSRIHEEMIKNVQALYQKGQDIDVEIPALAGSVSTSIEEIVDNKPRARTQTPAAAPVNNTVMKDKKIAELKARAQGKNDKEKAAYITKITSFKIDEKFNISQGVATLALARLLDTESKK